MAEAVLMRSSEKQDETTTYLHNILGRPGVFSKLH